MIRKEFLQQRMIERLSEPVVDPPFFYSVDPTFASDPTIQAIIQDREDERLQPVFITGYANYPPGYESMQFKIVNGTRMFCRTLRVLSPEDGYWLIMDEWHRPTEEAETHYRKQLLHLDFPQVLKYEESMDYEFMRLNREAREKMHQQMAVAEAKRIENSYSSTPPPLSPWE